MPLDVAVLRSERGGDPEAVRKSEVLRGHSAPDFVAEFIRLDRLARDVQFQVDGLRAEARKLSKRVAESVQANGKPDLELTHQARELREQIKKEDLVLSSSRKAVTQIMKKFGNVVDLESAEIVVLLAKKELTALRPVSFTAHATNQTVNVPVCLYQALCANARTVGSLDLLCGEWLDEQSQLPVVCKNALEIQLACPGTTQHSGSAFRNIVLELVKVLASCSDDLAVTTICPTSMQQSWSYAVELTFGAVPASQSSNQVQRFSVTVANETDFVGRELSIRSGPKRMQMLRDGKRFVHTLSVSFSTTFQDALLAPQSSSAMHVDLVGVSPLRHPALKSRPDVLEESNGKRLSMREAERVEIWLRTHTTIYSGLQQDKAAAELVGASGLVLPGVQFPFLTQWLESYRDT